MAKKQRKARISSSERRRRRLQAMRNFGLIKKRKRTTTMARRKRSRRGGSNILRNSAVKTAIGAGLLGVAEPFMDDLLKKVGLNWQDDFVKIGAGFIVPMVVKNGYVRGAGNAAIAIGTKNLVQRQFGGMLTGATTQTASATTTSSGDAWRA